MVVEGGTKNKTDLNVVKLELLLVSDDLLFLVQPARLLRLEGLLVQVRLLLHPLAARPENVQFLLQLFDLLVI